MYEFRNVDGKIIILYDIDEFIATECAHQMVQRGFENVFVVSNILKMNKKISDFLAIRRPQTNSTKATSRTYYGVFPSRMFYVSRLGSKIYFQ